MYPQARVDVYGTMITLTIMKYFYICLVRYRNIRHVQTENNTEKQGAWLFSYSF